jgi:hypothetical protein
MLIDKYVAINVSLINNYFLIGIQTYL